MNNNSNKNNKLAKRMIKTIRSKVGTYIVALASYLVFIGLYYSVITIFSDSTIRNSIRKFIFPHNNRPLTLLECIGRAYMQYVVEKRKEEQQQQALSEQIDLEKPSASTSSITLNDSEDEIKQYLEMVIEIVKKEKRVHENRI